MSWVHETFSKKRYQSLSPERPHLELPPYFGEKANEKTPLQKSKKSWKGESFWAKGLMISSNYPRTLVDIEKYVKIIFTDLKVMGITTKTHNF